MVLRVFLSHSDLRLRGCASLVALRLPQPAADPAIGTAAPVRTGNWLNTNVVLLSLGYVSEGYLLFMFISWLYIYLVEVRGFSLVNVGFIASLPWVAAIAATPLGGFVSDRSLRAMAELRGRARHNVTRSLMTSVREQAPSPLSLHFAWLLHHVRSE